MNKDNAVKRFVTFVLVAPLIAAIVTTIMFLVIIQRAGNDPFRFTADIVWLGFALFLPYMMIGFVPAGLLSVFDGFLAKQNIWLRWLRPMITATAAFVVMAPFLDHAFQAEAFPENWQILPVALHTVIPALFCSLLAHD